MKKIADGMVTLVGVLLIGLSLVFLKQASDPQGLMRTLPYICIGIGCGAFGHGMGNIIKHRRLKNKPALQRQLEIEEQDERNQAIANKAKGKAYDVMIPVFGALMLSFALMEVDLTALLMLVGAYLFVVGYGIVYRIKYDKEM